MHEKKHLPYVIKLCEGSTHGLKNAHGGPKLKRHRVGLRVHTQRDPSPGFRPESSGAQDVIWDMHLGRPGLAARPPQGQPAEPTSLSSEPQRAPERPGPSR